MVKEDINTAMKNLPPFFAAIPYDIQLKDEKYYQTIVHLIFRMPGLYCRSEVRIAAGRIDTLVETKKYVYCFEFKLDGNAEEALGVCGALPLKSNIFAIYCKNIPCKLPKEPRNA